MSLPYHHVHAATSHGVKMYSARATQLRDLPPGFLAAFGANVKTPYRVYDPAGQVITDREGKYKGGVFTPLDVIVPQTLRATAKPVTLKAPDPALKKLLEEQKIENAAKKLNAKTMRSLQDELAALKAKLAEDDASEITSIATDLEEKSIPKDEAKELAKSVETKKDDSVLRKAAEFLITKPSDMRASDLLKVYKKLDIVGIKGSSTPVKVKIAESFEKETGISFKSLLGVSKSKLPGAASSFAAKFNDTIKPKMGKKKVITDEILRSKIGAGT